MAFIAIVWQQTRCVLAGLFLCLTAAPATAFKVDTHVFVAQQILNDMEDDGELSIELDGIVRRFRVGEDLRAAILRHPAHFRMGSIGADAFPGIIAGQSVIHPGDESSAGWGTGDWLNYVETVASGPEEVAFAAGYKVHAASDAFAHSYVNHYAGDVWDLTDGTHVEQRHFILESFIASKNPPLLDYKGRAVGSAAQAVLDGSGGLAIPAEFVAAQMIFSPTSKRFDSGAPHLAFLGRHERNLVDAVGKAEHIAQEIEKIVLYYYTGIAANSSEIRRLRELANAIRKALIPVDTLKDISNEITEIRKKHAGIQADVVRGLLAELGRVHRELTRVERELDQAARRVAQLHDDIRSQLNECKASKTLVTGHCKVTKEVCKALGPLKKFCEDVTDFEPTCMVRARREFDDAIAACERISAVTRLRPVLDEATKLRNRLQNEVTGLYDEMRKVADEIENLMIAAIELENQLLQSALDLVKLSQGDINIAVQFLKSWHQGVRRAGTTYVLANGQAMVNAMTAGGDPLEPLKRWLECHALPIAGLPHPLNDAACSIGDAKESILGSLKRIVATLGKIDPVSREVFKLIEELEKQIREIVTEAVVSALQEVTGQPIKELLKIIKSPGTAEAVTHIFTSGEAYGLRSIPDTAYRVGAEMGLSQTNQFFDPQRYSVVYNAVTLSKLSLLSVAQLNELATMAGVQAPTIYGSQLFAGDSAKSSGVLTGALRSIDGSHQWFTQAMPFLRTWSHEHAPLGRYTYLRGDDAANGFRLWQDDQARDKIFRRVFRGPLVPGIDAPETIGFPPVLLSNYPYRICEKHPWPLQNDPAQPDVIKDTTCSTAALAPLLDAYPDLTRENADKLRAVHKLLAPQRVDETFLTGTLEWACVSRPRDASGLQLWSLLFTAQHKVSGNVSLRDGNAPEKVLQKAVIVADYEVIGDFLFVLPQGAGFIQPAEAGPDPTLLRRFTSQPQRYWIDRSGGAPLALWNQDGTQILCTPALANNGNSGNGR